MCPTPPTPITTAVDPGVGEMGEPADRVVGGQAGVGVRRDGHGLDTGRQQQERTLRHEHVLGEAAVDRQAGELVPDAVHVVAAAARNAEAAAVRRVDEHRVALRDGGDSRADLFDPAGVLVAEDARQRDAGGLHQPLDRVQVGGADPGAADSNEHVRRAREARAPAARRARAAGDTRASAPPSRGKALIGGHGDLEQERLVAAAPGRARTSSRASSSSPCSSTLRAGQPNARASAGDVDSETRPRRACRRAARRACP